MNIQLAVRVVDLDIEWARRLGLVEVLRSVLRQELDLAEALPLVCRKLNMAYTLNPKVRNEVGLILEEAYFGDIRSLNDLTRRIRQCVKNLPARERTLNGCPS